MVAFLTNEQDITIMVKSLDENEITSFLYVLNEVQELYDTYNYVLYYSTRLRID